MGVFGVDVSNHQPNFDFAAARRNGFEFAILKVSEGSGFKDAYFARHLREARAAGMLVAGYHYQRTDSVASQVANIKSMAGTDVPIIIDVENGSGGVDITRGLVAELRKAGYRVPFTYLPRWYWNNIGTPSLAGLPDLWASWYPDYQVRPKEQGISMVPPSAWSAYGGISVGLMQFTSSPYDQNFFRGTTRELADLLGGKGEEDMANVSDAQLQKLLEAADSVLGGKAGVRNAGESFTQDYDTNQDVEQIKTDVTAVKTDVAEIKAKVEKVSVGGVDLDALVQKLKDAGFATKSDVNSTVVAVVNRTKLTTSTGSL